MANAGNTDAGGSPPRLWGIQDSGYSLKDVERFTPTPVGNTLPTAAAACAAAVHPHACGEYPRRPHPCHAINGSPPRLWGIPGHKPLTHRRNRFTPTPVGNTAPRRLPAEMLPVHPHACGEYVPPAKRRLPVIGSPPRLWGIQIALNNDKTLGRFTPTPVGNTTLVEL